MHLLCNYNCFFCFDMKMKLQLSSLPHTWLLDFDGTLVKHNGYKNGADEWLPGALEFLRSIPKDDMIIILTARKEDVRDRTISFIAESNVRIDSIIFDVPIGERILVNDAKPSGLDCARAICVDRDQGLKNFRFVIDEAL